MIRPPKNAIVRPAVARVNQGQAGGPSRAPRLMNTTRIPLADQHTRWGGFYGVDIDRLVGGWTVDSASIDWYLYSDLRPMRARARELERQNEYAKNFLRVIRRNVVGADGVMVQSQVRRRNGEIDKMAQAAIEEAWQEWCENHCDYHGRLDFIGLQKLLITTAARDGEFLVRRRVGAGPFAIQYEVIDPALLDDRRKWERTREGGEIRLGVERDRRRRRVAYWIRDGDLNHSYSYDSGRLVRVPAGQILHGFMTEHADQSRGIPWMHAAQVSGKRLEMFDSAAMSAAQAGAMAAFGLVNKDNLAGDASYTGDDDVVDDEGEPIGTEMVLESGTVVDFGDKTVVSLDPHYPHEMYDPFTMATIRRWAAGVGVSYASVSQDLRGVNYSSIRSGVLEDREEFKTLQGWFIRDFVAPAFRDFVEYAIMSGELKIAGVTPMRPVRAYQRAHFQGRRWSWVDPQKDMAANQQAVDMRVKSRSAIIREAGGDPDTVFAEIAAENEELKSLGIQPIDKAAKMPDNSANADPDDDKGNAS